MLPLQFVLQKYDSIEIQGFSSSFPFQLSLAGHDPQQTEIPARTLARLRASFFVDKGKGEDSEGYVESMDCLFAQQSFEQDFWPLISKLLKRSQNNCSVVLDFVRNSHFYSFDGRVEELVCDLLKEFFFSERNSGVALQLAAEALRRVESPEVQSHLGFFDSSVAAVPQREPAEPRRPPGRLPAAAADSRDEADGRPHRAAADGPAAQL